MHLIAFSLPPGKKHQQRINKQTNKPTDGNKTSDKYLQVALDVYFIYGRTNICDACTTSNIYTF